MLVLYVKSESNLNFYKQFLNKLKLIINKITNKIKIVD